MHARLSAHTGNTKAAILAALVAHSNRPQRAIARDAGVSPSHLCRIINGSINPTDRTFLKIIQATGASPTMVGLACVLGPDNMPLIARSAFFAQLLVELPNQLLQRLGDDLIDADPRWATNIINYVITKTAETVARKRKAETEFMLDL